MANCNALLPSDKLAERGKGRLRCLVISTNPALGEPLVMATGTLLGGQNTEGKEREMLLQPAVYRHYCPRLTAAHTQTSFKLAPVGQLQHVPQLPGVTSHLCVTQAEHGHHSCTPGRHCKSYHVLKHHTLL